MDRGSQQVSVTAAPAKHTPMNVQFSLSTGRYAVSTEGAQRLIRGLRAVENENRDALVVGAMLKGNLADDLPSEVTLIGPNEVEAVLLALEEAMGHEPLSQELYTLRNALLREPT
jgi:hypothetical protein